MNHLIPPKHNSDGRAEQPSSVSDMLQDEEQDTPYRLGVRDAIKYLIHNHACAPEDRIDTKRAINIRWNLKWTECDQAIQEATPLAEAKLAELEVQRADREQRRQEFEKLSALFESLGGLQVSATDQGYTLHGLSERRVKLIADLLLAEADQ